MPLDERARDAADQVAEAIGEAVAQPFLPAAPDKGQCDLCDYRVVCGPHEERRTARKPQGTLEPLLAVRSIAMTDLADAEARRRILTEFGTSFFVEAAAGTGKTTALVGRIVGLVRTGAGTLDRIVAVTFTEKAAGEMKLRLRSEIEKARASGGTRGARSAGPRARGTGARPYRHDPRLLRRSSARAAGRGRDRSALRGRLRGRGRGACRRSFRGLVPDGSRRSAGGRPAHSQTPIGQAIPARAAAQRDAGPPRSTAIFRSPGGAIPSTGTARSTR